jgi:metal-dependent amidase/aminoacylase/carboxypeptidase family protein
MKQQSEQVARAMAEQARAMRDTRDATNNISQQVQQIMKANAEYAASADSIRVSLGETRSITDRNARTANDAIQATTSLLDAAQQLSKIMDQIEKGGAGSNGSTDLSNRKRRSRKNEPGDGLGNGESRTDEPPIQRTES